MFCMGFDNYLVYCLIDWLAIVQWSMVNVFRVILFFASLLRLRSSCIVSECVLYLLLVFQWISGKTSAQHPKVNHHMKWLIGITVHTLGIWFEINQAEIQFHLFTHCVTFTWYFMFVVILLFLGRGEVSHSGFRDSQMHEKISRLEFLINAHINHRY